MAKRTKLLFSLLLFFTLTACQQQASNESNQYKVKEIKSNETLALDVRENVWNQLTEEDKKHIQGTWKDASYRKIILRETMGIIKDKSFIGKEVYIVDFPSNDNPTLGGVAVYADLKSHLLIGYGYRD